MSTHSEVALTENETMEGEGSAGAGPSQGNVYGKPYFSISKF